MLTLERRSEPLREASERPWCLGPGDGGGRARSLELELPWHTPPGVLVAFSQDEYVTPALRPLRQNVA